MCVIFDTHCVKAPFKIKICYKKWGINIRRVIGYITSILVIIPVLLLPLYYKIVWKYILGGTPAEANSVDILAFWGAVFGAIITLVGVFLTIRFSERGIEISLNQQVKENFYNSFPVRLKTVNMVIEPVTSIRRNISTLYMDTMIEEMNGREQNVDDLDEVLYLINDFYDTFHDLEQTASSDGYVYYKIRELINDFNEEVGVKGKYGIVDDFQQQFNNINNMDNRLEKLETELKSYKKELEDRFIDFSKEDGYGFKNDEKNFFIKWFKRFICNGSKV